jgi:hypothetical protein
MFGFISHFQVTESWISFQNYKIQTLLEIRTISSQRFV